MAIIVKTIHPIRLPINGINVGMGWPSTRDTAIAGREALTAFVKLHGMKSAVNGATSTKSMKPMMRNSGIPIAKPRLSDIELSMIARVSQNTRLTKNIPNAPAYGKRGKAFPAMK